MGLCVIMFKKRCVDVLRVFMEWGGWLVYFDFEFVQMGGCGRGARVSVNKVC